MRIKDVLPIALTAISVVGSIAAVIMAANETPKAVEILDDKRLEIDPTGETDISVKEKAIICAKSYWKTEVLIGVSITASIASCVIGHKNYRALMASTAVLSTAYAKHKDKVKKFIGEEKAKLIDQQVKESMKLEKAKNPTELVWFYDTVSDTYFQMTWQDYWNAKICANRDINTYGDISLGNMFPNIKNYMEDKNCADYTWFYDDIVENYGYPWLDIYEEAWNMPYTEGDKNNYDKSIRDGKPTWVIRYGIWPLPPDVARDLQYIGTESDQAAT